NLSGFSLTNSEGEQDNLCRLTISVMFYESSKALTDCNQQLINAENLVTPQELKGDNGCFFVPFPEQFNPYTMICPDIDTA
ncbi:8811_t:CDS:2, partial [Dentiscutata erythropus]